MFPQMKEILLRSCCNVFDLFIALFIASSFMSIPKTFAFLKLWTIYKHVAPSPQQMSRTRNALDFGKFSEMLFVLSHPPKWIWFLTPGQFFFIFPKNLRQTQWDVHCPVCPLFCFRRLITQSIFNFFPTAKTPAQYCIPWIFVSATISDLLRFIIRIKV